VVEWNNLIEHPEVETKLLEWRVVDYKKFKELVEGIGKEALGFSKVRWNELTLALQRKEPHSLFNFSVAITRA